MQSQNRSFEDLPPELRAEVYTVMSPPLNGHIGEYHAILLANHALKSEVEGEWVRNMCRFLQGVVDSWSETYASPLRIDMSKTVLDIKYVKMSIPKSVVRDHVFKKFPVALVPLLELHISSMSIKFYEDESFRDDKLDDRANATKDFNRGMWYFIMRMQQILDKATLLNCDDDSLYRRKDTLNVDVLNIEWDALSRGEEGAIDVLLNFTVLEYRKHHHYTVGSAVPGVTWTRISAASTEVDKTHGDFAYTRDLPYH